MSGAVTETYHIDAYLRLLARQVEALVAPFGLLEEDLREWLG